MNRLLVLGLLLPLASTVSAQDAELGRLLDRFEALEGLECRFREERRVALIAAPLVSEGRIFFDPPGRFLRRTEAPEPASMRIADGELLMVDGDRTERMAVDQNPVLQAFLESFRAVLAGDRDTLERFYRVELTARDGDAWSLRLVPRDAALARFVRDIALDGEGVRIRRMVIREVSGDVSETAFRDVDLDRRFSAAEARALFGSP
jgi:outer membrane lipoprotein-sorting protein